MFPCKLLVGTFVFHGVGSMTDLGDFFWQKKKKKRWRRGVETLIYLALLLLSSFHFHSGAPVLWYFS